MTAMDSSVKRAVATIVGVFLVAGACVAMAGPGVRAAVLLQEASSLRLAVMKCDDARSLQELTRPHGSVRIHVSLK